MLTNNEPLPSPGLGYVTVRLLNVLAGVLMLFGSIGWWATTRVIDPNGFADVVASAVHDPSVRSYVSEQVTLRLARTTPLVVAARPVVSGALAAALDTRSVEEGVRSAVRRAHRQLFRVNGSPLAELDAAQASVAIRAALDAVNPELAKKLPANLLQVSTQVSQSSALDIFVSWSRWIRLLYLPLFGVGVFLLVWSVHRARETAHALRSVGYTLGVIGAILIGLGSAAAVYTQFSNSAESAKSEAVVAFLSRLLGRLRGCGQALLALGLSVAFAPGRDGGDLGSRIHSLRSTFKVRFDSLLARVASGSALIVLALLVRTMPGRLLWIAATGVSLLLLYVGVVVVLRSVGLLRRSSEQLPQWHLRGVLFVAAALVTSATATAGIAVVVVSNASALPKANAKVAGCNGYIELCYLRLDQIMFPASHNAMSTSSANFLNAEHTISIPEQLNSGIRFLMLDLYYGYDDHGLTRTNLAGGTDETQLLAERGQKAVDAVKRVGALTGTADLSGKKKDIYLCHSLCELGASRAKTEFDQIRSFLERNRNEVVILDLEDYVSPTDIQLLLQQSGLLDRVWAPTPGTKTLPYLGALVEPAHDGAIENKRRLIVMSEKHGGEYPWLLPAYSIMEETPFTFKATEDFTCNPNRGGTGKPLMLINHWLRTGRTPSPLEANTVNSEQVLTERIQQCMNKRGRLVNIVATDFTEIGDLIKTTTKFNAAVAAQIGVSDALDQSLADELRSGVLTPAERQDIDNLKRLPRPSSTEANTLIGPNVPIAHQTPSEVAAAFPDNETKTDPPTTSTTSK